MRSGSTASALRTWAAPPHSPAWIVIRSPPSRATANASAGSIGSGNASSGPARSQPVTPCSRNWTATRARSAFAAGSCERSAVQINRTTVPVRKDASRAPAHTAPMPSTSARPPETCSRGPHRISTYRTPSAAFVSTSSAVIRSSASASCMSAIGRSKARSSSACDEHGIGAMSAADIASHVAGASIPRVRASSSAVSTRSDPSRWRCSSAFGIASTSLRSAGPVRGVLESVMRSMLRFRHLIGPTRSRDSPQMSTILVTGASGFVGSHLVPVLVAAGHRVVGLVRSADSGERVVGRLPAAAREGVETRVGDVTHPATLGPALERVDAVVHLVAIPRDFSGGADLRLVNTEGTRAMVVAMQAAGVRRLIHMGAMGVEDVPDLHYASSKAKAEALVRDPGLDWTILKPSLQFGEGDGFFNIIAGLVRLSPGVVPVPGNGRARFQPIHTDDVATVVVRSLTDPTTVGGSFELGGPRYWTYREITAEVLCALGKRRVVIPMPVPLIRLVAGTSELVRIPFPVATDQLRQLRLDNIGPLDLIPSRFRFEPPPMEGALGYLKTRQSDQVAVPAES